MYYVHRLYKGVLYLQNVRSYVRQFSWNSQPLKFLWAFPLQNLIQIGRKILPNTGKFHLLPLRKEWHSNVSYFKRIKINYSIFFKLTYTKCHYYRNRCTQIETRLPPPPSVKGDCPPNFTKLTPDLQTFVNNSGK